MKRFLVLCNDHDLYREIRKQLRARFPGDERKPSVRHCDNSQDADELVSTKTDLLVVVTDMAEDPDMPPAMTPEPAVEFLRHIRRDRNLEVPAILVFRTRHELESCANEVQHDTGRVFTLYQGPELFEKLCTQAERALTGAKAEVYLKVRIYLESAEKQWRYECIGKGFSFYKTDMLRLDDSTLRMLLGWGRGLGRGDDWEVGFYEYGSHLMELLFAKNLHFRRHFDEALQQQEIGLRDTRVQFFISPEYHDLVLESLREPNDAQPTRPGIPGDDYWGVIAPLYRKVRGAQTRPLFKDAATIGQSPINCLIINANLPKGGKFFDLFDINGEPLSLSPLKHVDQECDAVDTLLQGYRRKLNLGDVMKLQPREGETDFSDRVEDTLRSGNWHHVHYSGHSFYDSRRDLGYVFFPDSPSREVKISAFANWLVNTRFIFVNSCESGEARFVLDLMNHQVPAVCGYRWQVNDSFATEYATKFYEHLFAERSLERAFQSARRHAFKRHRKDRIWASSMLVMAA